MSHRLIFAGFNPGQSANAGDGGTGSNGGVGDNGGNGGTVYPSNSLHQPGGNGFNGGNSNSPSAPGTPDGRCVITLCTLQEEAINQGGTSGPNLFPGGDGGPGGYVVTS